MKNPIERFHEWLADAVRVGMHEPTAMALATVDAEGLPNVRMVLLKHADDEGFVFYTNLESPKADELRTHPNAALCFYWRELKRQVRIHGPVTPVTADEADAYFETRPRLSQIGAWASRQSRPLPNVLALEQACAGVALEYPVGPLPRPPFWSGFRVAAQQIEFWSEKPFRRHERILYIRDGETWKSQRLFP